MNLVALSLAASATFTSASVPSFTFENFDSLPTGTSLFIKYFIPGCVYCEEMESAWEKLAAEWEGSDYGFLFEVDCEEGENEELCEDIDEYPTLKFGEIDEIIDLTELDDYDGGTDYESLSEFAKNNLKPSCSVSKMELCDDNIKNLIDVLKKKPIDDLYKAIDEIHENVYKVEDAFIDRLEALNQESDELFETLQDRILLIKKESYYNYMEEILALKKRVAVEA